MSRAAWKRTARISAAVLFLGDVAGLLEVGGARVVPGHHRGLGLRAVAEAVVVVLGHVHAVSGTHLDVIFSHAGDAVPGDQVLDLLAPGVAVDLVAAAGREVGDAEDRLVGADALARDQPADVHVDPAGLAVFGRGGDRPWRVDVDQVRVAHRILSVMEAAMASAPGRNASSRLGLYGIGASPVVRRQASSRSSIACSAIWASTPLDQPPVLGPSSTTIRRFVLATDFAIVSMSSGRIVRTSITSRSTSSRSAASRASCTPRIAVTTVTSPPSRTTLALPSGSVSGPLSPLTL